jgi:2,3-bisphosphoglycerate-independent phosphoglycerate mutase
LYDVIILNFANCDMVGHTGIESAAIKAVETVDTCAGRIIAKVRELGGAVLITADHGNAEQMQDEGGEPFTAHTTNPVWLVLVDDSRKGAKLREGGRLADIAPTMLKMLGIAQPREMTGESLL